MVGEASALSAASLSIFAISCLAVYLCPAKVRRSPTSLQPTPPPPAAAAFLRAWETIFLERGSMAGLKNDAVSASSFFLWAAARSARFFVASSRRLAWRDSNSAGSVDLEGEGGAPRPELLLGEETGPFFFLSFFVANEGLKEWAISLSSFSFLIFSSLSFLAFSLSAVRCPIDFWNETMFLETLLILVGLAASISLRRVSFLSLAAFLCSTIFVEGGDTGGR
mmetsp:Transcript_11669/g.23231  ORF Transcript_11669/g.23231 Transcript_11669/m.23231 type:complete len:223 (-) Transcript_11669:492-1160(-)